MMEILEYIMKTPENTNPNILKEMLQDLQGSSDSPYLVVTNQIERGPKGNGATGEGYTLDYSYDELMQASDNEKTILIYDPNISLAYVAFIGDNEISFNEYKITPDNTIIHSAVEPR